MRIYSRLNRGALLLLLFTAGSCLHAQDALKITMEAFKLVVNASGEIQEMEADTAHPGDVIVYRATFTNGGDVSLNEIAPQIPVPASLIYVSDSAKPEPSRVILRGSGSLPYPAIDPESGSPSDPASFAAILWEVSELAAGESFQAEIKAVLPEQP